MVRGARTRDDYPLEIAAAISPLEIAAAWERELPGAATGSITVITPLWRAAKLAADDRRRTLSRLGLQAAVLDLLSTLRRAGPPYRLTTRQITERTLVSAGAVSQRLARAEHAGLIERSPSSSSPRAVEVALTAAGHRLIESAVRELLDHEEHLVSGLSREERATLSELLARLTVVLRGADQEGTG